MRHLLLRGGPGNHDFEATAAAIAAVVADGATTTVGDPRTALDHLAAAEAGTVEPWDLLTVDALWWRMEVERYAAQRAQHAFDLGGEDAALLDRFVRAGGGLLAVHTAVICFDAHTRWHDLLGASWDWDRSGHGPISPVTVRLTPAGEAHPATAGLDGFVVDDELYEGLRAEPDVVPLAVGRTEAGEHPVAWVRERGAGRVAVDLLGHGPASLADPGHRDLLARLARWAARPARTGGAVT